MCIRDRAYRGSVTIFSENFNYLRLDSGVHSSFYSKPSKAVITVSIF